MINIKYNVLNWSNKSKKTLINLLICVLIGMVIGICACLLLITNGKHDILIYQTIGYIIGGFAFCILIFVEVLVENLETIDDLDKKIRISEIEIEKKKLDIEELKLKQGEKK